MFSVIIPSYNSGDFLEETLQSVILQRREVGLEIIVVDGGSNDVTPRLLDKYSGDIDVLIVEPDTGPANAINKGFSRASGEIVSWLNADDLYHDATLGRVKKHMTNHREDVFCFGGCRIIDTHGNEIRKGITRFKECFFPVSSRFTYQCINYISQPAMFFRRSVISSIGQLREDMVAAWDYEFLLRLWKAGSSTVILGEPLSSFRWHENSISGQSFQLQFKEELDAAVEDAGNFSPQVLIHYMVRWGIVGVYSLMAQLRKERSNYGH